MKQAVSAQQITSPHPYKKDYKEQIVGKGPQDPSIGYPEHEQHKKASDLASQVGLRTICFFTHVKKLGLPCCICFGGFNKVKLYFSYYYFAWFVRPATKKMLKKQDKITSYLLMLHSLQKQRKLRKTPVM